MCPKEDDEEDEPAPKAKQQGKGGNKTPAGSQKRPAPEQKTPATANKKAKQEQPAKTPTTSSKGEA